MPLISFFKVFQGRKGFFSIVIYMGMAPKKVASFMGMLIMSSISKWKLKYLQKSCL